MQETTLFRARVPAGRLKKAEKILSRLGLNLKKAVGTTDNADHTDFQGFT